MAYYGDVDKPQQGHCNVADYRREGNVKNLLVYPIHTCQGAKVMIIFQ